MDHEKQPVLAARGMIKHFGGVKALSGVDIAIWPAEVHALVGENGAGKSTLIKILAGMLRPTAGDVLLRGERVEFANPLESQAAGISVIAQELNLVPQMSVVENIFLGREPRRRSGLIDWPAARRRAGELLAELGLAISPAQRVETLSIADKQLVEVAKALSQSFEIMIMDEPTASLSADEVSRLFGMIRKLRDRGVAILYVSHRLGEVFQIADRITVFRDGRRVLTDLAAQLSEHELVRSMVGRDVAQAASSHRPRAAEDVVLAIRRLSAPPAFDDISFELRRGEILGVAGLVGSGRLALMRTLFGLQQPSRGEVLLDGRPVMFRTPRAAIQSGVFLLTDDRKADGLFPDLTVLENVVLARRGSRRLVIDDSEERRVYTDIASFLQIRGAASRLITTLSGGNQQKALFGRSLASAARVLLLCEPTRGVDVGVRADIWTTMRRLAEEGVSIIVTSSDAKELEQIADHCLVLRRGRVVAELAGDQVTEDRILAAALSTAEAVA